MMVNKENHMVINVMAIWGKNPFVAPTHFFDLYFTHSFHKTKKKI
jgi:hypothetical protein